VTDYPQVEAVKEFDRNEKPTDDDDLYTSARLAAIEALCDETQRELVLAPADATARTFVPDGCSVHLYIGDCVSITSVVENGVTLIAGTDYQAEPVRRTNWAGTAVPYNSLRRFGREWYYDEGRGTVVVTARWGVSVLPARAIEAVRVITSDIVANRDVQLGVIGVSEGAVVSIRTNPTVAKAIQALRGPKAWGIG
jgi:hypothetical protein